MRGRNSELNLIVVEDTVFGLKQCVIAETTDYFICERFRPWGVILGVICNTLKMINASLLTVLLQFES